MFVALSWDQTINWTKTFQISPVVPNKTTAARASWNVIATEYQIRSGDQLLSWRIAALSGNTIVINPKSQNSGQYCYSTDGKTLICNKDLSWSIQQIFEWDTWKLRFKKIIIENFTWTIMTGTNDFICVKSGDMIDCNINPDDLWGWSWINVEWTPNHRCSYQCEGWTLTVNWTCWFNVWCSSIQREVQDKCGTSDTITDTECIKDIIKIWEKNPGRLDYNYNWDDCSINCNEPAPTIPDTVYDSIITIKQWSNTQQFSLNQSTDKEIILDLWSGWGWEGINVEWVPWKRCKYACTAIISGEQYDLWASFARVFWVSEENWPSEEVQAELNEILSQLAEWKMPDNVSCNLDCNYTPSSTTTNNVTIAWDPWYLCTKVSDTKIECLTDPADFSWWGNTYIFQWTAGLWTGIKLNATTNAITPTNNMRYLYLTWNSVIRHKWALSFEVQGLNAVTSPVKFDAMWARFWAHADNAYWLWTIGWVSIAGRLLVWQHFDDNYIYIYASWSHSDDDRHYEIRASKELAIGTDSWAFIYFKNYDTDNYKPFRVWVNTRDPAATLDVNWSLRINTNDSPCVLPTCNGTTAWSIIFRSNNFYWCKYKNWWYWRYRFEMADTATELSWTTNCASVINVSAPQQGMAAN